MVRTRQRFGLSPPAVFDSVTDPEVPPLPRHITFEVARHFVVAVARGG
jgi:hypothetical protein